jgi:hypothetical protein
MSCLPCSTGRPLLQTGSPHSEGTQLTCARPHIPLACSRRRTLERPWQLPSRSSPSPAPPLSKCLSPARRIAGGSGKVNARGDIRARVVAIERQDHLAAARPGGTFRTHRRRPPQTRDRRGGGGDAEKPAAGTAAFYPGHRMSSQETHQKATVGPLQLCHCFSNMSSANISTVSIL